MPYRERGRRSERQRPALLAGLLGGVGDAVDLETGGVQQRDRAAAVAQLRPVRRAAPPASRRPRAGRPATALVRSSRSAIRQPVRSTGSGEALSSSDASRPPGAGPTGLTMAARTRTADPPRRGPGAGGAGRARSDVPARARCGRRCARPGSGRRGRWPPSATRRGSAAAARRPARRRRRRANRALLPWFMWMSCTPLPGESRRPCP